MFPGIAGWPVFCALGFAPACGLTDGWFAGAFGDVAKDWAGGI
jgi:hypothetical protein